MPNESSGDWGGAEYWWPCKMEQTCYKPCIELPTTVAQALNGSQIVRKYIRDQPET